MVFQPIIQKRTAESVVERFRLLILDGVLRPGDRLPAERQLALDLDVSRPILRDALAQLEADGLIVARHGEGTFIADLIGDVFSAPSPELLRASPQGMADYLEFRRLLEVGHGRDGGRAGDAIRSRYAQGAGRSDATRP
jgi:GntR family transcriptional repressor for pyruvate dehydrogenase complex